MEREQYIQINGKKLYVEYSKMEHEKSILYLHGGPGEGCFDFTFHQTERLGHNFSLISIDQRGVLRSEDIGVQDSFGLNDLIEDCEELRRELQIDRWSVIGHSFGGFLAVLYASKYPDSIERIVFEGPTFDFQLTGKALIQKTASLCAESGLFDVQQRCLSMLHNSSIRPRELVEGYMKESEYLGEERMRIYTHNFNNPTDTSVYTEEEWDVFYGRSEVHYDRLREEGKLFTSLLPLLKELSMPCLLIMGEHDVVTCPVQLEAYQQEVRLGETYIVPDCGHTPHYEAADEFYMVVRDFLQGGTDE